MPSYNRGPCACCENRRITGIYPTGGRVHVVYAPNYIDYYNTPHFEAPYIANIEPTPAPYVTHHIIYSDGTTSDFNAPLVDFKDVVIGGNTFEVIEMLFEYDGYMITSNFRMGTLDFYRPTPEKYDCDYTTIINHGDTTWEKVN